MLKEIECLCGCGKLINSTDDWGRKRKYAHGHNPPPIKTLIKKGEHRSVRTEFKKGTTPSNKGKGIANRICSICKGKKSPYSILCRPCHIKNNDPWNKGKKCPDISIRQMGDKNHSWKGWTTPLRRKIYSSLQYKEWRKEIFNRDSYVCQLCGVKNKKMHVDHIFPFFLILEKNKIKTFDEALSCKTLWDINNGRTLCVPCHKKTPTYGNSLYNKRKSQSCLR